MSVLDILKSELTVDPLTRGYSGMSDEAATTDLNTEYRDRNLESMTGSEVFNSIDITEFNALTDTDKQLVWDLVHLGTLNPYGKEATMMQNIFGGGSDTITALQAARKESISRGVELGLGLVKVGHVSEARR